MARSAQQTHEKILTAAYRLLYRDGFARTSMDAIAAAAGVTKRTLYYHFDCKDALAGTVLEDQHLHALALFKEWAEPTAESPSAFLQSLFERLETWASGPRWLGSGFTRLTMELAEMPGHPVRQAAHRHKAAVETWLGDELSRLGAADPSDLARQVMLLTEGTLSLVLIHHDPGYCRAAARAAVRLAQDAGT
jgi:AcrR family transcriptional regulator